LARGKQFSAMMLVMFYVKRLSDTVSIDKNRTFPVIHRATFERKDVFTTDHNLTDL